MSENILKILLSVKLHLPLWSSSSDSDDLHSSFFVLLEDDVSPAWCDTVLGKDGGLSCKLCAVLTFLVNAVTAVITCAVTDFIVPFFLAFTCCDG